MKENKRSRSVQNIVIPDNIKIHNEELSKENINDFSKLENSNFFNTYNNSQ